MIPASPERIYKAWLSSKEHSAFSGGKAVVSSKVGGKFTAWDGYISGRNIQLRPGKRIVQSWRTTEFPNDAPDSRLEIIFIQAKQGTKITLNHTRIPSGQAGEYRQGWKDYYFEPMKQYFA